MIDGEMVGIERVVAAYFEHYEVPYYAIYFHQETGNDYFDENMMDTADQIQRGFDTPTSNSHSRAAMVPIAVEELEKIA